MSFKKMTQAEKALAVFVLNHRTRAWLKHNDPKALEQAEEALAGDTSNECYDVLSRIPDVDEHIKLYSDRDGVPLHIGDSVRAAGDDHILGRITELMPSKATGNGEALVTFQGHQGWWFCTRLVRVKVS